MALSLGTVVSVAPGAEKASMMGEPRTGSNEGSHRRPFFLAVAPWTRAVAEGYKSHVEWLLWLPSGHGTFGLRRGSPAQAGLSHVLGLLPSHPSPASVEPSVSSRACRLVIFRSYLTQYCTSYVFITRMRTLTCKNL